MRSPLCSREQEQLGVEEPLVVLDGREQPPRDVGAHRLEPTLRVAHRRGEHGAQHEVVRARDDLALRMPRDRRARRESRSDREVGVPGDQGRHAVGATRRGRSTGRRPCTRPLPRRSRSTPTAARGRDPSRRGARARTPASSRASCPATNQVPSVDPLSTMVIRQENGNPRARYSCNRRTPAGNATVSL